MHGMNHTVRDQWKRPTPWTSVVHDQEKTPIPAKLNVDYLLGPFILSLVRFRSKLDQFLIYVDFWKKYRNMTIMSALRTCRCRFSLRYCWMQELPWPQFQDQDDIRTRKSFRTEIALEMFYFWCGYRPIKDLQFDEHSHALSSEPGGHQISMNRPRNPWIE